MGDTPAISVVLAVYNGGRYIRQQAESIAAQTIPPLEVVICDDGSTDESVEIARRICVDAGIPVRYLPPDGRLGVTANFDRGCAAAVGVVIALCDQDDVWHPEKLARLADRLTEGPGLLVASDADLIDERGDRIPGTLFDRLEIGDADLGSLGDRESAFPTLLRRNLLTGATVAFRRELLTLASPFPISWVHDEWLVVLAAAAGPVEVVPEPLISYRLHGSNQIGVIEPTLRAKLRAVFAPRGDRTARLADRSDELWKRLESLGDRVRPGTATLARSKADFEAARSRLSRVRAARIPRVLSLALAGGYRAFASRRTLDIARDLLQRP